MTSSTRLWWIVLGLSIGPAVSNGFARFSYGLILPAMREDLGWSYTEAGWINTANAVGYLAGALLALGLVSRWGPRPLFIWGMALTAIALAFSAMTRDFWWLSFWRVLAGVGGAPVFIAGGVIASGLFADDKQKNALAIALYFGGGGFGMIISGILLPLFMQWFGDSGWPLAWLMMGVGSFIAFIPSAIAAEAAPAPDRAAHDDRIVLPVGRMLPALTTYFMFGLGYIIYITFLIAWMSAWGAQAPLIAGAWALMGVAVTASPFLWRGILASANGGRALALTSLATGAGIALPLISPGAGLVILSALLFGASFFMVPTAVTAFSRKNLDQAQWGPAMAVFTMIFALGQIIGPVAGGAIADAAGETDPGLLAAACVLLLGALIATLQRPLR